jgi:hypothetical protein
VLKFARKAGLRLIKIVFIKEETNEKSIKRKTEEWRKSIRHMAYDKQL